MIESPADTVRVRLEDEIDRTASELVALFRAEYVLWNCENDQSLSEEMREKRKPFLQITQKMIRAELKKRLEDLYAKIGEWQKL